MLPQQPPPPPSWASAAPPQQAPAQIAPWAAASERLNTFDRARKRVDDEQRMVRWARFAVAMPGRLLPRRAFCCNGPTRTSCAPPATSSASTWNAAQPASRRSGVPRARRTRGPPIGLLVGLLTIAAVDHRLHLAAQGGVGRTCPRHPVARTRRPGASGCWFVPIVNLWMPYGAIRDCLPPRAPAPARVCCSGGSRWCCTGVLSGAAGAAALFSTGTGLVLSIPAALACLAVIAWAPGIVVAIAASHAGGVGRRGAGNRGVAALSHARLNPSLGPAHRELTNCSPRDSAPVAWRSFGLATFLVVADGEITQASRNPVTTAAQSDVDKALAGPRSRCGPPRVRHALGQPESRLLGPDGPERRQRRPQARFDHRADRADGLGQVHLPAHPQPDERPRARVHARTATSRSTTRACGRSTSTC